MSEKRRDLKNRILRRGESQRKDGRYAYKYVDTDGKTCFIYSWTLEKYDVVPKGKKVGLSLREKEKAILQAINDDINFRKGNDTVLHLVERYLSQKENIRPNSKKTYNTIMNILNRDPFGRQKINNVRTSDAKDWCLKLQRQEHKKFGTVRSVQSLLKQAFQMACDDDYVRKNPFDFKLSNVLLNDSVTRDSLTKEQKELFLKFVREDKYFKKYYDGIYILFETGLRISEFVGLTIKDIDFQNRKIYINHQLLRNSNMDYYISSTKTNSGLREFPMTDNVIKCFQNILLHRKTPKKEPIVDGFSGFLFLDRNEKPMVALHWENYFLHICKKYNKMNPVAPIKVTPHICRHTFCSEMSNLGMNPKLLGYLMGHSNISVTLDVYTHSTFNDAEKEFKRVLKAS